VEARHFGFRQIPKFSLAQLWDEMAVKNMAIECLRCRFSFGRNMLRKKLDGRFCHSQRCSFFRQKTGWILAIGNRT
jgi:hypothetical protein